MDLQINEWFEKEFNLSTFSLTDYTEKNCIKLLGSLIFASGAFIIGGASLFGAIFLGLPLALIGCDFLMSSLLMVSFTCASYDIKVLYEIVAKLIDFLAMPVNLFRQEKFVFGKSVQATTDAVKNFFSGPTTSTTNPVGQQDTTNRVVNVTV